MDCVDGADEINCSEASETENLSAEKSFDNKTNVNDNSETDEMQGKNKFRATTLGATRKSFYVTGNNKIRLRNVFGTFKGSLSFTVLVLSKKSGNYRKNLFQIRKILKVCDTSILIMDEFFEKIKCQFVR